MDECCGYYPVYVLTRKSPAIEADVSLPSERVVRVLDRVVESLGLPEKITCDNGPEFVSRQLALWAERRGVELGASAGLL